MIPSSCSNRVQELFGFSSDFLETTKNLLSVIVDSEQLGCASLVRGKRQRRPWRRRRWQPQWQLPSRRLVNDRTTVIGARAHPPGPQSICRRPSTTPGVPAHNITRLFTIPTYIQPALPRGFPKTLPNNGIVPICEL